MWRIIVWFVMVTLNRLDIQRLLGCISFVEVQIRKSKIAQSSHTKHKLRIGRQINTLFPKEIINVIDVSNYSRPAKAYELQAKLHLKCILNHSDYPNNFKRWNVSCIHRCFQGIIRTILFWINSSFWYLVARIQKISYRFVSLKIKQTIFCISTLLHTKRQTFRNAPW